MDDLISRQAAIDAICMEWCGVKHQDCKHPFDVEKDDYCDGCWTALRTLPDLPSAERKGKWIRENVVLTSNPPQYQWHCSECGRMVHGFTTEVLTKYCPDCGARNKEEEKE